MRVAVSQRVGVLTERGERRDALDQRMAGFLAAAGLAAVPVANGLVEHDTLQAWLEAVAPSGLVLTGGEDQGVYPERDATEAALLAHAEAGRLPVLGICRGLQVMGVRAGAALVAVEGHRGVRHVVGGLLKGEVNSFHALALQTCPAGFEVLARSPDGVIEAIGAGDRPWEAWMWHPEREPVPVERDVARLRHLFAGAGR